MRLETASRTRRVMNPEHPSGLRGLVRIWYGLLLASLCAIVVVFVRLARQTGATPPIDTRHWLVYLALLTLAGSSPFAVAWALSRWLNLGAVDAGERRPLWLSPAAAVAVLSIGLTALALVTYRLGNDTAVRAVSHRLEAVATLKATLIGAWMESETGDIRVWTGSPEFNALMDDWRRGGTHDAASRQHLLDYLRRVSKTGHYTEVGLRDAASGELLLTTTTDGDTASVRQAAVAAATSALPVLEDFHSDAEAHSALLYLGFFYPVAGVGPGVVVHVGLDPEHELFPLIEQWPGSSDTAEVLLLRRDGDSMLIVNDSRAIRAGQPVRRIDALGSGTIGTAMSQGATGLIRGTDDRGQKVLCFAQPVADTTWLIAAKLDDAEAFAELNRIVVLTASVAAALLLFGTWRWVETRRHAALEKDVQREREENAYRLSVMSRRTVLAQEEERRHLSVELHDRTGGNLATIDLNLKSIEKLLPPRDTGPYDVLRDTRELLADTIVSIREFCGELRPSVLDHAGLDYALSVCLAQFARRTGIATHLDDQGFSGRLQPDAEVVLYRICQEALLNCAKHSDARNLHVTLTRTGDHVTLTIEDDGVGFASERGASDAPAPGMGLLNMRERAAFIGGSLTIDSAPGKGTHIKVDVG